MNYPKIVLQKGKEESIKRYHPWIFSGAVKDKEHKLEEGDIVDVYSSDNQFLGCGYFQKGSIAVRILSFKQEEINKEFWKNKLQHAFNYRKNSGIFDAKTLNVYRLVHAEGDSIPGLIIDIFNDIAVFQAHSSGIYRLKNAIYEAIIEIFEGRISEVYDKSREYLNNVVGVKQSDCKTVFKNPVRVNENNHNFLVDIENGQKTGFYIDQRENRYLLSSYAKNKRILNVFSYTGAFSVYGLKSGADLVHSVDSSQAALDICEENIRINQTDHLNHLSICSDAFDFLNQQKLDYDIVILDPPAFAKRIDARHQAVKGYKRLNSLALSKMKPKSLLFTFSCSQAIDRQLFNDTIRSAAIESHRKVKIISQLGQAADHPINIFHPESEYLKGLVLWIE